MKVLKYSMVFFLPALFICGLVFGGWLTFSPFIFAFGIIPLLELLFKPSQTNIDVAETEMRKLDWRYDLMLYLVVPVIYILIGMYLLTITNKVLSKIELAGLTISLGVILGGLGINVAHELGHRHAKFEQTLAKLLLLPSAYMHFFIEHNRGHHKNVSTQDDPASSRYNESIYHFWPRTIIYSYISAWRLENQRLSRQGTRSLSFQNEMLRFQLIQIGFWLLIALIFGIKAVLLFTGAAIIGFLMLETVNYIEHYGLARNKVSEFRYEKVLPIHSWNSNHVVGRMMLFELSRHSDHHFQPAKKYQLLAHHENSPQMPTGYPGMMLLSLVPPLWFSIMNKRIKGQKILVVQS